MNDAARCESAETLRPRRTWRWAAAVIGAGALLYGWQGGARGIWSAHEGRAAQNAANILMTGDWLLPRLFTGEPELQKPPAYYWAAAAASALHGSVDGWSVRLPALLAALVALGLAFDFGRRLGGPAVGATAATILLCCTRFAWLARVGRIDMPLCLLTLAAMLVFAAARVLPAPADRRPLPWGFWLLVAIGMLFKGPVAAVFVALPILCWMFAARTPPLPWTAAGRAEIRALRVLPGAVLALAVAGPWFAYASWKTDGLFFTEFFIYHNLDRALGTEDALKPGPFWFYLPRLFTDTFPWSLLAIPAGIAIVRGRREWTAPTTPRAAGRLLLLCWAGADLLFLSVVSFKRLDYPLPVYPALALLLAEWLADRAERFRLRRESTVAGNFRRRSRVILFTACGLAAAVTPLLVWGAMQFAKKGGLVKKLLRIDVLDDHLNKTDEFMMTALETLLRDQWWTLGVVSLAVVFSVWALHSGWHERRNGRVVASFAVPWAVCFALWTQVYLPRLDAARDLGPFGAMVRHYATAQRPVYYFLKVDSDLVFHAGKPARLLPHDADLLALADSAEPTFVVMRPEDLVRLGKDPRFAAWREIARNGEFGPHRDLRSLVTNRPELAARPAEVPLR